MFKTLGLTGGIGSGKSTVARRLSELGAQVIDADRIGHEVYAPGSEGFAQVQAEFGNEVVASDGSIDRKALGAQVFADPSALARLEAIVHPLIGKAIASRIAATRQSHPNGVMVIEAAVLLEASWDSGTDEIWVVTAPRETVIERVMRDRGLSQQDVEQRIANQLSNAARCARADIIISNEGTLAELEARVETEWAALRSRIENAAPSTD